MAKLSINGVFGVKQDGDYAWRADGIELADNFSRRRPLKKLGEPLALRNARVGEFVVYVGVAVFGIPAKQESYLITDVDRRGLGRAVLSDAVLERPDELMTPYLHFWLSGFTQHDLGEWGLSGLGDFLAKPAAQTVSPEA